MRESSGNPRGPRPSRKRANGTASARPDIFAHHDYREFLKAWFAYRKSLERKFSLRSLAKEAGLAVGYLPTILAGHRHLSRKALAKLLPKLGLNRTEGSYFAAMTTLGGSDSQAERLAALEKMRRFGAYRSQNTREVEVHRYLTRWYFVAIREMASIPGFRADAAWVAERLGGKISLAEAREALDFLTANGFIEKLADGSIKPPDKTLDCLGGIYRLALGQFHRQMLELASAAIEAVPSEERSLIGHTVAISPESLEAAKSILDDAMARIEELGRNQKNRQTVYHFELALFPLTRRSS